MPDIDTYLLRSFVTVAERGTVVDAARLLHRTQAAVSMQIRRLEATLDTVLFERTPTGLRLSENGARLLPQARNVLLALQQMQATVASSRKQHLRLGIIEDIAATRLPGVLQGYSRSHPEVAIDLVVGGNRMVGQMFNRGEIDVAVCDVVELHDHQPVLSWHADLVWAASASMPVSRDIPLPVVMFSETCAWRARAVASLNAYDGPWEVACEASTLVAMTTAILAGSGIGLLLPSMVPPGCISLEGRSGPEKVAVEFGVFVNAGQHQSLREFVEAMAAPALQV